MNRGRDVLFVLSALLALRFFCLKFKLLVLVLVMRACVCISFVLLCVAFPLPQIKAFITLVESFPRQGGSRHVILKLLLILGALHNSCPSQSCLGHAQVEISFMIVSHSKL